MKMKLLGKISLVFVVTTTLCPVYGVPMEHSKIMRISGGREALQGEAPYQITLQSEQGLHFCGAALVNVDGAQIAITAAHCFLLLDHSNRSVYLVAGDLDLTDNSGIEQKRVVGDVVTHPNFSIHVLPVAANDIALLFFDPPFVLNDNVSTVALPIFNATEVNTKIIVTGWGDTSADKQSPPKHLQLVELPIVKHDQCKLAWNVEEEVVVDSMICAATPTGAEGTCHGDSGGPAVGVGQFLVGIVSFGKACAQPGFPYVFTKVAYFLDWIREQCALHRAKQPYSHTG